MGHDKKLHTPFKFNPYWLGNEDLVNLLKKNWKVYDENSALPPVAQFQANLKKIKNVSICWSVKRKEQDTKELNEIEVLLEASCTKLGFGFSTDEDKVFLYGLESRRRKILLDRENEARQKSRAIWLLRGDENTHFFINMPITGNMLTLYGR